jgi:hypothetical protein
MRVAPALAAVAVLLLAAPAFAGTARLETGREGSAMNVRVVYRATPGVRDSLQIFAFRGNDYGGDRFEGAGVVGFMVWGAGVIPGTGCEVFGVAGVACPLPAGKRLRGPVVHAGDQADSVTVTVTAPGTRIFGGPGSDSLTGPLRFRAEMHGGPGGDTLEGRGILHGGAGADSLSSVLFGGEAGPSQIFGGSGDDVIDGGARAETIQPGSGRDTVFAGGGADVIRASDGFGDVPIATPVTTGSWSTPSTRVTRALHAGHSGAVSGCAAVASRALFPPP